MTRRAKIAVITIFAIILMAGIVICALRWKVWFSNPPEAAYSVASAPHNIVLSYGEQAVSSRVVSWRAGTQLQTADVELLSWQSRDTLRYSACGTIVHSRAGEAAYYRAVMDSLSAGNYWYRCRTADEASQWYPLFVADRQGRMRMQEFLVFGDVQDTEGSGSEAMYDAAFALSGAQYSSLAGMVFAGDIIERPTDTYWQVFFNAMNDRQAAVPVIAATGNHEYLKGVRKTLDPRWVHVFGNPDNGPHRFRGRTYFIDFPTARFIVLDTDALQVMSDYTVMQTWLRKVLDERNGVWKVVVMHHPVHAAGKGRDNPLIRFSFAHTLKTADIVFCGHDHNYMRRNGGSGKPMYILTNSSEKYYTPKDHIEADCHAAYMRFYEDLRIYPDSLRVNTWCMETDSLFDTVLLQH